MHFSLFFKCFPLVKYMKIQDRRFNEYLSAIKQLMKEKIEAKWFFFAFLCCTSNDLMKSYTGFTDFLHTNFAKINKQKIYPNSLKLSEASTCQKKKFIRFLAIFLIKLYYKTPKMAVTTKMTHLKRFLL